MCQYALYCILFKDACHQTYMQLLDNEIITVNTMQSIVEHPYQYLLITYVMHF